MSTQMDLLKSENARVHLNSTGKGTPRHPGTGWTRFVCISDTHSCRFDVPPGDILIHAGDLSHYSRNLPGTIDWLKKLEHPIKIIIAGNHDLYLDRQLSEDGLVGKNDVETTRSLFRSKAVKNAGIHYLEYESFQFITSSGKQWKVYGSPAAPRHSDGSFQYDTPAQADAIYGRIPPDTEVLITHTPPRMILDRTRRGKNVGCTTLAAKLPSLTACRLHVFGHIHEAHGAEIIRGDENSQDRVAVNAALFPGRNPIIVDLKDYEDVAVAQSTSNL